MLRALPAGIILLLISKQLPNKAWLGKVVLLGALNFSIFWWLLFVSAYRLPGGVAATLGAIQPLIVIVAARVYLSTAIHRFAVIGALLGVLGVGLLLLNSQAKLDVLGIIAGLAGACSMALGTVLSKKWFSATLTATAPEQPQIKVTPLTLTAWQLVAGGLLLVPFAFYLEPPLPSLDIKGVRALGYLGLIGAGLTYLLWFRGLSLLPATSIAPLGFLSPLSAVILGWLILDQHLSALQMVGALTVLFSVWLSQQRFSTTSLQVLKSTYSK
jgi:probable blue pigment (indigoidine) exporter